MTVSFGLFPKWGKTGGCCTRRDSRSFYRKTVQTIQDYCRYGDVEGTDDQGRPVRKDWYVDHNSGECIVWGHDPRPYPERL